jgi:phytoene dehydrogenase-like protein
MALAPVAVVARERFESEEARALFAAGISHSDVAVTDPASTPGAIALAMVAQGHNMPVAVGGASRLAEGLASAVTDAGGTIVTGQEVTRVVVEGRRAVGVETAAGLSLRARRAVLADAGPARLFLGMVGEEYLPASFLAGVRRFRYGSGIFKLDLALDAPPAWDGDDLDRCGVVHLTGDLDGMARANTEVAVGELPTEPMLVVGQPTVADPTRAPAGGHTLWIETHVPPRPKDGPWPEVSDRFLERVLDRLDGHAPGVRSRIVGHAVHTPPDLEAANPNLVNGDLGAGSMALDQQLVFRPVPGWFRYRTPVRGLYLCSASTHPGPGVHGMVGRNCAHRVLRDAFIRRV